MVGGSHCLGPGSRVIITTRDKHLLSSYGVEKTYQCLIKHGLHHRVTLHDLIEDMGKEIVRQESPKDPGKRKLAGIRSEFGGLLLPKQDEDVEKMNVYDKRANVIINSSKGYSIDLPLDYRHISTKMDHTYLFGPQKWGKRSIVTPNLRRKLGRRSPDIIDSIKKGWHFKDGDGYEHEFIEKIVKEVSRKINRVALPVADYPVGLDSHVQHVISLLDVRSDNRVLMVGIYGIGVAKIPEWFEHQSCGPSISFWCREKFPAIALCLVLGPMDKESIMVKSIMIINGKSLGDVGAHAHCFWMGANHMCLFDLQKIRSKYYLDAVLLKNKWNHVEVSYETLGVNQIMIHTLKSGIHVFEQNSNMEHVQFTDPQKLAESQ
ncbi:hypothetical protein VNO77_33332 [Canavalia gladiata]|uniref:Uncharacterized protein n=1 Tax=Canavalia gladiata TaxID=3824 RepID=A0AAN9KD51_CANGL